MEHGGQSGIQQHNHVQNSHVNGTANASSEEKMQPLPSDKGKAKDTAEDGGADAAMNGGEVKTLPPPRAASSPTVSRMNDLPDEITHITQGFFPLSRLLTRLAQSSHNRLQEKIAELANMPLPSGTVNGNASHSASAAAAPDDISSENLRKKSALLPFVQDLHAKFVKALVITEWSRRASKVSKLIDLKFMIDQQRIIYDTSLDNIINVKRDLTYARMPRPDLKTALQVLSTGSAPWIPELQYIEPPSLTSKEQLKWINDLDTLLSLRLNIDDFDKIPAQFRNYKIASGRVTFTVPEEFEVDLTIADEDFGKQFWFIDFRFLFSPAAASLSPTLRAHLEASVNESLAKDGLKGCYELLHEFVLTSKINQIRHQAMQLSKSSWTGSLTLEPLHRALAVQYWTPRSVTGAPKSWIMLAVTSGREGNTATQHETTSSLSVTWYRDGKEVKDARLGLDVANLSAEDLLTNVVALHVEWILQTIHDKIAATPRVESRDVSLTLRLSRTNPTASSLTVQVGHNETASIAIEAKSGTFSVTPHSKFTIQYEHQLNNSKTPAEDGSTCLENIRCALFEDELTRRGVCMGWGTKKSPLNGEQIRSLTRNRDWTRIIWLQRDGWDAKWFVALFLGLGGDEWWLIEANNDISPRTLRLQAKIPFTRGYLDPSDRFWNHLTLLSTGMIVQAVEMRELRRRNIKCHLNHDLSSMKLGPTKIPSIETALSGIFPAIVVKNNNAAQPGRDDSNDGLNSLLLSNSKDRTATKDAWASDNITIKFLGAHPAPSKSQSETEDVELLCTSEAIITVERPAKFAALEGMVDREVAYNARSGQFCLRMQHAVGQPVLPILETRIKAVRRFVNFIESLEQMKGAVSSDSVTLREVTCSYSEGCSVVNGEAPRRWRLVLDLSKENIVVNLEEANPHLRVLDLLQRLVNSEGGIGALLKWLPASMPAFKTIHRIEQQWQAAQVKRQGRLKLSIRTIDWIALQYFVPMVDLHQQPVERQLSLELRLRVRKGEPWWHIKRSDAPVTADEFAAALKSVWLGKGDGWHGVASSAVGRPTGGVSGMLEAVDGAVRSLVGMTTTYVPPPVNPTVPKQPQQPQKTPQQKQQQQKQGQQKQAQGKQAQQRQAQPQKQAQQQQPQQQQKKQQKKPEVVVLD